MANPHQREVAVFEAALQLPPEQRQAYLEQTCGADVELLRRIQALLKTHESETGILTPAATAVPPALARSLLPSEKPGDKIGPYKLLQQIGEGGCGVVYMAEQEEPIRRRVALKVIKLGMDTKQVIARFDAERQALARMDHPNIAKIYDAGVTSRPLTPSLSPAGGEGDASLSAGRPYFVMELVRGVKITEYCNQNNLSTRERLDLFIQVCHAVQHAHQKGVIHRDLKPSNVLVTVNDGVAVPKVIDFGIAKATEGRLTDQTVFTAFEQFIGTPAYMSPEQAAMTSLDIDTRSDIYSLGVLLYELLTGKTPFDTQELLQAGLNEMRRTICEKEPPKPSTRLTQELARLKTGSARASRASDRALAVGNDERPRASESRAEARSVAVDEASTAAREARALAEKTRELIHALRGDLDWIAMKCLEKDRARRYETANGLARDIERHLNCEPVLARPPSKFYEFQKTVRRHKFGFAATAAVFLALALGFGISTWMYVKEREMRRELEVARIAEHAQLQKADAKLAIYKAGQTYQQRRRDQAENLLGEIATEAIEPDSAHAALRRQLAWWHVIHQEWSQAASNLVMATRTDAMNSDFVRSLDVQNLAPVLIWQGETASYDDLRKKALADFADTKDPMVAEVICKTSLFLPGDASVMKDIDRLYPVILEGQTAASSPDDLNRWGCFTLALIDYRRGDFAKAVTESQCASALVQGEGEFFPRAASANAVLAMCYYQLQKQEEARDALAQARRVSHNMDLVADDRHTALSVLEMLFDALDAQILIREADTVIEGRGDRDTYFVAAEFGLSEVYQNEFTGTNRLADAIKWYRIAADHGSFLAQNSLAWIFATSKDPKFRDGINAVHFAEQAVAATERKNPGLLDTLAAAYAEAGQFADAINTQKEAIGLLTDNNQIADYTTRLILYQKNTPYRQP